MLTGGQTIHSFQCGVDDISRQREQIIRKSLEEGGGQEPDAERLAEEIESDISGGWRYLVGGVR